MTRNVGSIDRVIRIVLGIVLIAFAVAGPAEISWKWIGWIGVVPLLTAIVGWCPIYSILGIRTCPAAK
ncbi:MAG: DUF2892 domain-containing protein [Flavobacteriaceae bacterium]